MNLTSVVELFTDHHRIAYSTRDAFGATNHKLRQSERRLRSPYTLKIIILMKMLLKPDLI